MGDVLSRSMGGAHAGETGTQLCCAAVQSVRLDGSAVLTATEDLEGPECCCSSVQGGSPAVCLSVDSRSYQGDNRDQLLQRLSRNT